MKAEFEIRPVAPLPSPKRVPFKGRVGAPPSPFTLALASIEVGQSFVVPFNGKAPRDCQNRVCNRATIWAKKRGEGRKFATRCEPDGIAVWRVK